MKLILVVATLITAVIGGAVTADVYRRIKYPTIPVEETDIFFDIGLMFLLGFAGVLAVAIAAFVLRFRKRRAVGAGTPTSLNRFE
jgi:hypothetical protein